MNHISALLLDRCQKKENVEQMAENLEVLADLKEQVEHALANWRKRKLPTLAADYLAIAERATSHSERIRSQAKQGELKLNIDVDLLVGHILKQPSSSEEVKASHLTDKEKTEAEVEKVKQRLEGQRARQKEEVARKKEELAEANCRIQDEQEMLNAMNQ